MLPRRALLAGSGAAAAYPPPSRAAGEGDSRDRARPLSLRARPAPHEAPPSDHQAAGIVGVFDADWLTEPRYGRMLDHLAASPRAFRGVRFFGALSAGEREDVFPTNSGTVWASRAAAPLFAPAFAALDALVQRGLTPFVALTFFPRAVSDHPVRPPADLAPWQELVASFLHAAAERYGSDELARWWFEAWNEPNMLPFWDGTFDRYLDLYRATSDAVAATGLRVRLGGPALAYLPGEGPALMERFLRFLAREPEVRCDFVSYHRKGIWVPGEHQPRLSLLREAAERTAADVLRLVPDRARRGLVLVNDEADMKVGFDTPYEPRLTERFPAWLAGTLAQHAELTRAYAGRGLSFVALSDNANQHLPRAPFDGRRALMTPLSADPADLAPLPVFQFYELLGLLGRGRACTTAAGGDTGVLHEAVLSQDHAAALLTHWLDEPGADAWDVEYELHGLPWREVNVARFRIDATLSNAYAAAGRRMPADALDAAAARRVRERGALALAGPVRRGVVLPSGGDGGGHALRARVRLPPYATELLWVTPYLPTFRPEPPRWQSAERDGAGNLVLRWTPCLHRQFLGYELLRLDGAGTAPRRAAPFPLRAAMWIDTAPVRGAGLGYAVRAATASGARSAWVRAPALRGA